MKTTTYHGCGHYWLVVVLHWDEGDEVIEGWGIIT